MGVWGLGGGLVGLIDLRGFYGGYDLDCVGCDEVLKGGIGGNWWAWIMLFWVGWIDEVDCGLMSFLCVQKKLLGWVGVRLVECVRLMV